MTNLIYLSPVPWASFSQRPQKFVEWFYSRNGGAVIWVDPYPTRFPNLRDLRRPKSARAAVENSNPDWITIFKPTALPLEPLPGAGWVNFFLWRPALDELVRFTRNDETLIVVGKPSLFALALLNRSKGIRSVYDAMDEFPAFYKGLSRFSMARREENLVKRVSILLVTSTRLQQRWCEVRPDLKFVPNALDASLLPVQKVELDKSTKKIFGYVGTIAKWFDWEWVIALANARTQDIIRLIGPIFYSPQIPLPRNIELLPECPHAVAMMEMRSFDVGLIPFRRSELTASVDPIKFYEYRALGLSVISTYFGEMAFRKDSKGTFISESHQDILALTELALGFRDDCEFAKVFAIANSWEARFDAANILL